MMEHILTSLKPEAQPNPDHIQSSHWQEWLSSCVAPNIIGCNVQSLEGQAVIERLLSDVIGDKTGSFVTAYGRRLLDRYACLTNGGWWVNGLDPLKNWQTMEWGQFKGDTPRTDSSGKAIKYDAPRGVSSRAIFLSMPEPDYWPKVLANVHEPIILTEGAKKAGCGLTAGFPTVAAVGIHGAYRKYADGKPCTPKLIPDIEAIAQKGRPIILAFDAESKLSTRWKVQSALLELGGLLEQQGCHVRVAQWDANHGKGIDDLVVNQGVQALEHAIFEALPFVEFKASIKKPNKFQKQYWELEKIWGEQIRYNEFTKEIEVDGKAIDVPTAKRVLAVDHNLHICSESDIEIMLEGLAFNQSYHPVRDYLNHCHKTYGSTTTILETAAERYLGTSNPLYNMLLKRFLISAVARIFEPGCDIEGTLILQNQRQGIGKSTFFKTLASKQWFDDSYSSKGKDKDECLKLQQFWMIEWAELEAIYKRRDIASLKAFMTTSVDVLRVPYGRSNKRMARPSVICGTTNDDSFLVDPTGSRRFWVIATGDIDLAAVERDRDQIWAAAVQLYLQGERWWLSPEERSQLEQANQQFEETHVWQPTIEAFLEDHSEVTIGRILTESPLKFELKDIRKGHEMDVAKILKRLGWQRKRIRWQGKWLWGWSRVLEVDQGSAEVDQALKPRQHKASELDPPLDPPLTDDPPILGGVDQASNPSQTSVSENLDPPDPPLEQFLEKNFSSVPPDQEFDDRMKAIAVGDYVPASFEELLAIKEAYPKSIRIQVMNRWDSTPDGQRLQADLKAVADRLQAKAMAPCNGGVSHG